MIVIGGFYVTNLSWSLIIQNILLLPLLVLLWSCLFKINLRPGIAFFVLIYSVAISTIISIGGIFTMKTAKEVFSNLVFLPITIQFSAMLVVHIKKQKNKKGF